MSDRIDFLPIAVWSTCVAIQTRAAINAWLEDRWERARPHMGARIKTAVASSGFGKVVKGGIINGWKLWLSSPTAYASALVLPPWPEGAEWTERTSKDEFSALVIVWGRSPFVGSGGMCILRRQSLLAPTVYSDIVRINFKGRDTWQMEYAAKHVSERIVALAFGRTYTNQIRIFLVDVVAKAFQQIDIASPHQDNGDADICLIFRDESAKDRIMILFQTSVDGFSGFELVEYEVRPTEEFTYPLVRQLTSRRLATFVNDWDFEADHAGWSFPTKFYFMESQLTDECRVVSVDRDGIRDLGDVVPWLARVADTPFGQKATLAIESFRSLFPPGLFINDNGILDDDIEFAVYAVVTITRSRIFGRVAKHGGVIQRSLVSPSLKRIAAESFSQGNPAIDFSEMHNAIGFDVFDGIFDGKETRVIDLI